MLGISLSRWYIEENVEINLYIHNIDYLKRKEQKMFRRHYGAYPDYKI